MESSVATFTILYRASPCVIDHSFMKTLYICMYVCVYIYVCVCECVCVCVICGKVSSLDSYSDPQ